MNIAGWKFFETNYQSPRDLVWLIMTQDRTIDFWPIDNSVRDNESMEDVGYNETKHNLLDSYYASFFSSFQMKMRAPMIPGQGIIPEYKLILKLVIASGIW